MIEAQAINRISLTFAPSVTIVFLFGLLWKCGDLRAALAILGIGYKVGVVASAGKRKQLMNGVPIARGAR